MLRFDVQPEPQRTGLLPHDATFRATSRGPMKDGAGQMEFDLKFTSNVDFDVQHVVLFG